MICDRLSGALTKSVCDQKVPCRWSKEPAVAPFIEVSQNPRGYESARNDFEVSCRRYRSLPTRPNGLILLPFCI
jgi:hypothetical protein